MSSWSQIQNFWVNYDNRPPDPPASGFYPSGGQVINSCHPELIWNPSYDPDLPDNPATISYLVQIADNGEFGSAATHSVPQGISHLVVPDSLAEGLWYFRIQATDDQGASSIWSAIQSFDVNYVNSPPQPPLTGFNPADGEEVISLTPTITWNYATDPDPDDNPGTLSYAVRLSRDSTFQLPVYCDTTLQGINQFQPVTDLDDNAQYYYQVMTIDDGGLASDWSAIQDFWTNHYNYPPEPFLLYGPPDEEKRVVYYTRFSWGNTIDYDPHSSFTFTLQFSPGDTFHWEQYQIYDSSVTADTIPTDSLYLIGQRIYWRVVATDDDNLIRIGGIPEQVRRLIVLSAGDANSSGLTNGLDVTYLVAFLKGAGSAPNPILVGDANGDCMVNGLDVVSLVNYFKGIGPAPVRCNQ